MSNQGTVGLVVGGSIGAALGYLLAKKFAGDEERPPIIVRGGSLRFENTTTKRPGKHWKKVTHGNAKEWELDDAGGKKVAFFHVFFVPATGSACLPVEAEEVTVDFDSDGNGSADRRYWIKLVNERPVVIGTHDLTLDTDQTKLIAGEGGKITAVTAGSTVCASPTLVYLEPIKKR